MNARALCAAAFALALLAVGCGRDLPVAGGGLAPLDRSVHPVAAARPENAPIVVKPSKLNFTTQPRLALGVSESGYTGAFTIVVASTKVARVVSKSAKGPKAKVIVRALTAGKTTITVSDANHQKVSVPVSVTTAIVIVN